MDELLQVIRACRICEPALPHGCRPVLAASPSCTVAIIGQAPGTRVHATGIPWNDPSGDNLRQWLGWEKGLFYDDSKVAIVPMGFCFPGSGKNGDLPPRPECAPHWHKPIWEAIPGIRLTLLIGQYAQRYYLGKQAKSNLTQTVQHYAEYLPTYFPLPHPSPRNRLWLKQNPWYAEEVLPILRQAAGKAVGLV